MKVKQLPLKQNLKTVKRLFPQIDFDALSKAVIGLFHSASTQHGADCLLIATHAVELLRQEGVNAEIVIGECAIRVDGKHDGAVINHRKASMAVAPMGNAIAFHAWVKLNDVWFLDLTTYQFKMKMAELDRMDGGNTPVSWSPDYIAFTKANISAYEAVQQAFKSGVIHYSKGNDDQNLIESELATNEVDAEDQANFRHIYETVKAGGVFTLHGPTGSIELSK